MTPPRRITRASKRKKDDEDYQTCHDDDGDAGRPAVKLRAESSKASFITVKEQAKKKKQCSVPTKYADMSLTELRKFVKPFGVVGSGKMNTDELIQLCLLYDSPLTGRAASKDHTNKQKSCPTSADVSSAAPVASSTRRPRSTINNHSTVKTSTKNPVEQNHQSEIDPNTRLFTTPDTQDLQNQTRHNRTFPEEENEQCASDADDQAAAVELMLREKRTALSRPPPAVISEIPERIEALPSRERGTALPRPRPTVLSEVAKGKRRQRSVSSDDWVPGGSDAGMSSPGLSDMELEDLAEDEVEALTGMDLENDDRMDDSTGEEDTPNSTFDDDHNDGAREAIARMLALCDRQDVSATRSASNEPSGSNTGTIIPPVTNGNNDDLRQTVNDMATILMQLVSNPTATRKSGTNTKKPQGSAFRARIRSHMRTMMGLKEGEEVPSSATPAQQSSWKIYTSRKDLLLPCRLDRELSHSLNSSANDPCFPFKGGPGGAHANPQILLLMWTMMNRVGVSSFRPIWEESMGSPANKFLLTLATATFIHLVKCGEYDDIKSEDSKFDVVFKALREHTKSSIKRSFRQTNHWSQAKIRQTKKHGLRMQRLRGLKTRRNDIAVRNKLWPLCELIDTCCSEDETDVEESRDSPKKICQVKKFEWRNERLEALFLRLEAHDEQKKRDSPKGTAGKKPRTRIRDSVNRVISRTDPPSGLPRDCYDPEWLENLRLNHPNKYEELQIEPTPVLDSLEKDADLRLILKA